MLFVAVMTRSPDEPGASGPAPTTEAELIVTFAGVPVVALPDPEPLAVR